MENIPVINNSIERFIGNFVLFRQKRSITIDIVFCKAFTAPGDFHLTELDSVNSQIFLNVRGNDYYQRGIPGITQSIEETAAWLLDVAASCGATCIRTMGVSMGAYAALLFGHLMKANAIYACAPRLSLGRTECRSWRWNRARIYHPVYRNLSSILPELIPRANLVFPAFDIMDHHDIVLAAPLISCGHAKFVREFHPCEHGFNWQKLFSVPSPLGFDDAILDSEEHYLEADIGRFRKLAHAYTALTDHRYREALAILDQTVLQDPSNVGIHYQIGMMHALLGNIERSSVVLRTVLPKMWATANLPADDSAHEEWWQSRISADFAGIIAPTERTLLAKMLPAIRTQAKT